MLGVDLGLNVGSVIRVKNVEGKLVVQNNLVLKLSHEKELSEFKRIQTIAARFVSVIEEMRGSKEPVAIEEPIFSWGRKNPKGFAKNVMLLTLVEHMLTDPSINREHPIKIYHVNNKSAKKESGFGGRNKEGMILAYKKFTGKEPGHSTKYGQETLADAFFIALNGVRQRGK